MRTGVIKVVLICILALGLCGCSSADKLEIKDYKIHKMDGLVCEECVTFLEDVVKTDCGEKMGKINGSRKRPYIW